MKQFALRFAVPSPKAGEDITFLFERDVFVERVINAFVVVDNGLEIEGRLGSAGSGGVHSEIEIQGSRTDPLDPWEAR